MKTHIAYIVLIVAVLLCFTKCEFDHRADTDKYDIAIKQAEQKNDSLAHQLNSLKITSTVRTDSIKLSDATIKKLKSELEQIKKTSHEKITAIDSYTDDELQRFFTDRYGK